MKHFNPYIILFCFQFLTILIVKGQANPSFEQVRPDLLPCPPLNYPSGGTFNGAIWESRPFTSLGGNATADYYNTCASTTSDVYPRNEPPRTGNAYAGIFAEGGSYSEYLYQDLGTPLNYGTTYYIEFWVSLGQFGSSGTVTSAVNSLGMFLTSNSAIVNTGKAPDANGSYNFYNLTPQIPNRFPASSTYSTSSGWTKISGYYTPYETGVRYILIGNFRGSSNISYYFIDDVKIAACPSASCPCPPPPTISSATVSGPCLDPIYTYSATKYTGAQYSWSINNPNLILTESGHQCIIEGGASAVYGGNSFTLTVTMRLAGCTVTASRPSSYIRKTPQQCDGSPAFAPVSVYPNPASSVLEIEIGTSLAGTDANQDLEVKLFDRFGQQKSVRKLKAGTKKTKLDVRSQPEGLYVVEVSAAGQAVRKHIQIAR